MSNLITNTGCYDGISHEEYHRMEICDAPSISSSGLRALADCPLKYWFHSPLNPKRPAEEKKRHFELGNAAHDLVLMGPNGWRERHYILPTGFSRAATVKQADAIAAAAAAEKAGLRLLAADEYADVIGMAEALSAHPISKALTGGKAEQTLAWKDAETGVWLRCRPDWLHDAHRPMPDYKTAVSAHPDDFAKDVANFSYHQQAALYLEGCHAVFGRDPAIPFYFIVQEKSAPYIVQPISLDSQAMEWGRRQNRAAIRKFAACLASGKWPAYSDDFVTVGLPGWRINQLAESLLGA